MDELERGRAAFERRDWDDAWRGLTEADRARPLAREDLERLALSAGLTGRDPEMFAAQERLHHALLDEGNNNAAARVAFWLGYRMRLVGEGARASGWLARAQRLVEGVDCVEQGYLMLPVALGRAQSGDLAGAMEALSQAAAIGARFKDADLTTLGRNFMGRVSLERGETAAGLALIDEAMVAVTTGEVSQTVTGVIYCSAIATCQRAWALERAREWTSAMSDWTRPQPQLLAFSGDCLVYRAEILQLEGSWGAAFEEARTAEARFTRIRDRGGLASTHYRRAEIHRLRGEQAAAEAGYLATSREGGEPQPGLSLLRIAQGRHDAATSGLRRVIETTQPPLVRARYLPAWVEVLLAAGDVAGADAACAELEPIAAWLGTDLAVGTAHHARGAVRLAQGDARGAIEALRTASEAWQRLDTPYLSARTRVLLGKAYAAVGDSDGAALERLAAREVFERLGASPDLAATHDEPDHGLTRREVEVLRLVASGRSNKAIGKELFVSERTVDRHVSNLFGKIGVSTRAAATAWAYENGVVGRG